MVALETLVLVAALSAGETVLLEFTSQYCGPCKAVAPVVRRLANDGYPVRVVDVDRDRELAASYRVTAVPCFVMLANGREVDRVLGPVSYEHLAGMLKAARVNPPGSPGEQLRGQSPDPAAPPRPRGSRGPDLLQRMADRQANVAREKDLEPRYDEISPATAEAPTDNREERLLPEASGGGSQLSAQERAMLATVRLAIDEGKSTSCGTGTIIDVHGEEALILTCAHVFRDSQGKGEIKVTFCGPGTPGPASGHLITYDLKRDVALVSIRPGAAVTAMQVAPPSYKPQRGAKVFSVGCDHGREARLVPSRIAAIDKYAGPANVEVAGAPAEGRSGGGLFSEEGLLIGVCNFADPADNEGIYAALPSLHWQLAQIGQEAIFERAEMALARERAGGPMHGDVATREGAQPPRMADQMPPPRDGIAVGGPPRGQGFAGEDSEIEVTIRSKGDPQGRGQTFLLSRPSPEFLQRLHQEYQGNAEVAQPAARNASKNVFRAQSDR